MLRQTIIIFILTVLTSCSNEPSYDIQWGPNPRQKCGDWLTFDYDRATYYHDTSGTLWKQVYNDSLVSLYISSHNGKTLTADNIKNLDAILSCKMFCGTPDDSVFVTLTNPEHLVTFTMDNKVTGYISADFYSGKITSWPTTKSEELCALKYLFQTVRRQ